MRPLLAALALIVPVSGAAQDPESVIELRALARDGPDSVLVERVRRHPDDARRAVHQLLAAGPGSDSAAIAVRTEAERLANAYALAWRDSFPLRQVRRFGSLSAADRHATVAADSVRKAGDNALKSAGIEDAMRAWRESLRRFEAVADTAGIATAFGSIGSGFFLRQELDSAEVYLARSLDLAKRIGNNFTAGQAMAELGNVSDLRGDLEHASELYRHAGELLKRIGDTRGHARVQNGLGIIAARQGDLAGARRAFEAALSGLRAGGYPEETPNALLNLAHLAKIEGGYAEAAGHLREALSILRS